MHSHYETPGEPPHLPPRFVAPPVVFWYRMYAGAMGLLYAAVTVGGVAMIFFRNELFDETTTVGEILTTGIIFVAVGAPFLVIFALGTFIPPRPWAWIVGILLIGVGMTSCCCLPASLPLLVFWLKPEAQAYFGRGPAGRGVSTRSNVSRS
ncbi:MAG: hypothetical protein ACRD1X_00530 [Vicinamibacteria bacterium]